MKTGRNKIDHFNPAASSQAIAPAYKTKVLFRFFPASLYLITIQAPISGYSHHVLSEEAESGSFLRYEKADEEVHSEFGGSRDNFFGLRPLPFSRSDLERTPCIDGD
jgi:hypothetical protein